MKRVPSWGDGQRDNLDRQKDCWPFLQGSITAGLLLLPLLFCGYFSFFWGISGLPYQIGEWFESYHLDNSGYSL
jgi:hypothetical protein